MAHVASLYHCDNFDFVVDAGSAPHRAVGSLACHVERVTKHPRQGFFAGFHAVNATFVDSGEQGAIGLEFDLTIVDEADGGVDTEVDFDGNRALAQ